MNPFWRKDKSSKKADNSPAVVDDSLPKTAADFRIEEGLDRVQAAHEEFTKILNAVTKDIRNRMGEKRS